MNELYPEEPEDKASPSRYTAKQYAALEGIRDPRTRQGGYAAKPECANKVLNPQGEVCDDLDKVRVAIFEAASETAAMASSAAVAELEAIAASAADPTNTDLAAAAKAATRAKVKAGSAADLAAADARNFPLHQAEGRFLWIVDHFGLPMIYFQCATEGNPDVELHSVEA